MKQLIITDVAVIRLQPKTTVQQKYFITKSKDELPTTVDPGLLPDTKSRHWV
jgi:hypothetical protein